MPDEKMGRKVRAHVQAPTLKKVRRDKAPEDRVRGLSWFLMFFLSLTFLASLAVTRQRRWL